MTVERSGPRLRDYVLAVKVVIVSSAKSGAERFNFELKSETGQRVPIGSG